MLLVGLGYIASYKKRVLEIQHKRRVNMFKPHNYPIYII